MECVDGAIELIKATSDVLGKAMIFEVDDMSCTNGLVFSWNRGRSSGCVHHPYLGVKPNGASCFTYRVGQFLSIDIQLQFGWKGSPR